MRISDWSSDVCSSDLIAALAGVARIDLRPLRRTAALVDVPTVDGMARWPLTIDVDEKFYFKPDAGRLPISTGDDTPSMQCEPMPADMDLAIAVDRHGASGQVDLRS